ncbi:MAG: hypothetical protein PHI12_13685 [Dehalococcoidales bacterium]|nr:hypothetical protein [Dehalococcoidales bacterium]
MGKRITVIAVTLLTTAILLAGCISQQPAEPTIAVKDAAGARDASLSYIHSAGGNEAPSPGGDWSTEDITPDLLGITAWQFTKDDWTVTVTYPVVAPENIIYTVVVESQGNGWYWKGTVTPSGNVSEIIPFGRFSEERSMEIAREFLIASPTFSFDGIEESLELIETLYPEIEFARQFIFEFDCRHPGYGDRTGEILAQVITHHQASIAIERYQVVSAIMDEEWDMIQQKQIDSSPPPPAPVPAAPNDSVVTAKVIDIINTSGDFPWEMLVEIESSEDVPGYINATAHLIGEQITLKTMEDLSDIERDQVIAANVKLEGDERIRFYSASNIE